ncbi:hypothetical protein L1887_10997 [Cichorium endivia]|nr:hypothetical protein L1887_10997 [Cichorium endivia]
MQLLLDGHHFQVLSLSPPSPSHPPRSRPSSSRSITDPLFLQHRISFTTVLKSMCRWIRFPSTDLLLLLKTNENSKPLNIHKTLIF